MRATPALCLVFSISLSVSAQQAQGPLTDQRIVNLVMAGVSAGEILRIIGTAPEIGFDLSPGATDAMVKAGVSAQIIKAMAARESGVSISAAAPTSRAVRNDYPSAMPIASEEAVPAGQEYLSASEISAAISAPPNNGFVFIEDGGFSTPSLCQTQMPSVAIFTAAGWLNALSQGAKKRLLDYAPKPEDTKRVLTIVSKGCVGATINDTIQSITRVVLLSTDHSRKIEAVENRQQADSWQNSYGAGVTAGNLVSKFLMDDLKKIQDKNGQFAIATMNDTGITKIYTVKTKHLKRLGL